MKRRKGKPRHSVPDNVLYLLKDISSHNRLLLFFLIAEGVCGVITPAFGIYLPKLAVELATEKASAERILLVLGAFTVVFTGVTALKGMSSGAKYIHYNFLRNFYMRKLFLKSLDCDYLQIESAEGQTRYRKAMRTLHTGDWSGTSTMITSMLDIFTGVLCFILYSGVIASLNPFIVLLLAGLSAVNYFSLRFAQDYEEKTKDEISAIEKKLDYIGNKSADVKAGKDVRLYGMAGWFLLLRRGLLDAHTVINSRIKNHYLISDAVNALTLLLRDGAAYAYLIWAFSAGHITLGNFVLYFGAITGFSGWVTLLAMHLSRINGANLQMNDMRAFLECTDASEPENPAALPEESAGISVEFKDVCFSYDGEEGRVLKNFNLRIEQGEKLALVGVNGAGKTTIVKLLCGFYRPDSGGILINGTDIGRFRRTELFRLFSAVFQDITILPFTVAENVSMKTDADTDGERVLGCLGKAGLEAEIGKYRDGIYSRMLKIIDEKGIVLSGGQQQKLLMARALYKDAPLLILDEPTAALDPIAESETYERFHMLSRNKTAVYISHRLASTRFCDRIVFIKDGVAAESGTHEELMDRGGEYANMFEIQSHYYNDVEYNNGEYNNREAAVNE